MHAHDRGLRRTVSFAHDSGLPDGTPSRVSSLAAWYGSCSVDWHAHRRVDRPTSRVTSPAGRDGPQDSLQGTSFHSGAGGCARGVSQGAVRERLCQRRRALLRRGSARRKDSRDLFRAPERSRGRHAGPRRACGRVTCCARVSHAGSAVGARLASSLPSRVARIISAALRVVAGSGAIAGSRD
jgi:hypothetical protein